LRRAPGWSHCGCRVLRAVALERRDQRPRSRCVPSVASGPVPRLRPSRRWIVTRCVAGASYPAVRYPGHRGECRVPHAEVPGHRVRRHARRVLDCRCGHPGAPGGDRCAPRGYHGYPRDCRPERLADRADRRDCPVTPQCGHPESARPYGRAVVVQAPLVGAAPHPHAQASPPHAQARHDLGAKANRGLRAEANRPRALRRLAAPRAAARSLGPAAHPTSC